MDQRTVRVAVVAILCIVALSAAAATLDSTREASGGMGGPADDAGSGGQGGEGFIPDRQNDKLEAPAGDIAKDCNRDAFFRQPEFGLGLIAVVFLAVGFSAWRANKLVALSVFFVLMTPVAAIFMMIAPCPSSTEEGTSGFGLSENGTLFEMGAPQGGGMPGSGSGSVTPVPPPFIVMAALGVVLLVAVVVIMRGTDDEVVEQTDPDEHVPDEEAVAAIGRAAGEAADRIVEEGDVDNEVFRAWREMVDHLQVDRPESTTPGEFADAADAAGMSPDDVRELTDLFEAVRYGGFDPTADREQRAVDALRRIEREYAEEADE